MGDMGKKLKNLKSHFKAYAMELTGEKKFFKTK